MSIQPTNLQQYTETFNAKDATRSIVLRRHDAVVLMDFFGATVTQARDTIRTRVNNLLQSMQFATLDELKRIVEEANSQVYQARPSGANQGGSIVMATIVPAPSSAKEQAQPQAPSKQFLLAAYGDCRIWRLRQERVTLLYSGANAGYLGSFHLNQRDLVSKAIPLEIGDRLLLTTKRIEKAAIEAHATKASKTLLNAISKNAPQDVLGLVDSQQIEGSLIAASQQMVSSVTNQAKPLVLSWKLQVFALLVCIALLFAVFRQPLMETLSNLSTSPTAVQVAVSTNTNTPVPVSTDTNTPVPVSTDTPVPATDTPVPVPTDTPVPILQTASPVPTATTINTASPTATPLPTRIPTLTPTAISVQAPNPSPTAESSATSTELPTLVPLPDGFSIVLNTPEKDFTAKGSTEFTWSATSRLPDGYHYEFILWRQGLDPIEKGEGWGGTSSDEHVSVNFDKLDWRSEQAGEYQWGVRLARAEPYLVLPYYWGERRIVIRLASSCDPTQSIGSCE